MIFIIWIVGLLLTVLGLSVYIAVTDGRVYEDDGIAMLCIALFWPITLLILIIIGFSQFIIIGSEFLFSKLVYVIQKLIK